LTGLTPPPHRARCARGAQASPGPRGPRGAGRKGRGAAPERAPRPCRSVDPEPTGFRSADLDQVDDEDQGLPRLDHIAGAAVAVGQVRRDGELAAAADPHPQDALVPAGDDLADAELEAERLAPAPGGVELLPRGVRDPDVVHGEAGAVHGLLALADGDVLDLQLGRRRTV